MLERVSDAVEAPELTRPLCCFFPTKLQKLLSFIPIFTPSQNPKMAATSTGGGNGDGCILSFRDGVRLESYKYYLARRTVMEMLLDRGYDVAEPEINRSYSDFRSVFGDSPALDGLRIYLPLRSTPSKKILVIFCGTDEIRTAGIRLIYKQILGREGSQLYRLMLILQKKINSFARKEVETFPFKVEFFQISDLYANITKHTLQPKHKILTCEEKSLLLKKYSVEDNQLPKMVSTDALARYYGLEKGQVMKFTYQGEIVGSFQTYRIIV